MDHLKAKAIFRRQWNAVARACSEFRPPPNICFFPRIPIPSHYTFSSLYQFGENKRKAIRLTDSSMKRIDSWTAKSFQSESSSQPCWLEPLQQRCALLPPTQQFVTTCWDAQKKMTPLIKSRWKGGKGQKLHSSISTHCMYIKVIQSQRPKQTRWTRRWWMRKRRG